MHELYELKETLCEELKEYARKGKMSAGDLEVVDKLSHSIKNLDKIIEAYEEMEYSEESYARGGRGGQGGGGNRGGGRGGQSNRGGSYEGGRGGQSNRGSYEGSYEGGGSYESYARGRGRSARRDSMGRYSRADDMVMELRELMEDAPDERTRQEFERFIKKVEQM